jgi:hypothetical protein
LTASGSAVRGVSPFFSNFSPEGFGPGIFYCC